MKHPRLIMIIVTVIALVSCVPTTDTEEPTLQESPSPLNPVTFEPTAGPEPEGSSPEMVTTAETEQSVTNDNEVEQAEPTITEEMSTMTPDSLEVSNPDKLPQVGKAKEDLANRLNRSVDDIEIVSVELVTWPNSGMGCPQPGMAYTQVPVDGLLIRLSVDGVQYNYHSGGSRDPFLCQPSPTVKSTQPSLNLEEFITPPQGNIDK